ncbi:hypothetical protein EJ06DRAFT_554359 [Trichodelitschia bisporula]|uniref:Uncharacterized protein n=1 Tax=Trichodelitschia bisporula TaxID=703511 RepID=A0A6G1I3B5_9PEZI|nr:hypothetical protein EJ06DRAFT_554359 [Trichodelitschia bisporula]
MAAPNGTNKVAASSPPAQEPATSSTVEMDPFAETDALINGGLQSVDPARGATTADFGDDVLQNIFECNDIVDTPDQQPQNTAVSDSVLPDQMAVNIIEQQNAGTAQTVTTDVNQGQMVNELRATDLSTENNGHVPIAPAPPEETFLAGPSMNFSFVPHHQPASYDYYGNQGPVPEPTFTLDETERAPAPVFDWIPAYTADAFDFDEAQAYTSGPAAIDPALASMFNPSPVYTSGPPPIDPALSSAFDQAPVYTSTAPPGPAQTVVPAPAQPFAQGSVQPFTQDPVQMFGQAPVQPFAYAPAPTYHQAPAPTFVTVLASTPIQAPAATAATGKTPRGRHISAVVGTRYHPYSRRVKGMEQANEILYKSRWAPPDRRAPLTDDEKTPFAVAIYDAIVDFSNFFDKPGKTNKNRLLAFKYDQQYIEARCWEAVECAVRLHIHGSTLVELSDPTWAPKTRKEHPDRNLNFVDRITAVCDLLRHHKTACVDILDGNKMNNVIYAPNVTAKTKSMNASSNDRRAGVYRAGREATDRTELDAGPSSRRGSRATTQDTEYHPYFTYPN